MAVSTVGATPGAALTRMRLPNGWTVYQLNPAETSLQYRDIVASGAYLQHGLSIRPGDTVVDIGANIGISCLFFHNAAPDVRIYAFEPAPLPFEALRANVELHGMNANVFRCGLSSAEGSSELTYYPLCTAMSSLYAEPDHDAHVTRTFLLNSGFDESDVDDMLRGLHISETVSCGMRTLSSVIESERIERIDCLKLNVEKAEEDVLAGIDEVHWPLVQQITMQAHESRGAVESVRTELTRRGFDVHIDQDPLLRGTDIYDLFALRRHGESA